MSNHAHPPFGLPPMPAGAGLVAVPSPEQRKEIERVQGMQVRTNAVQIAGQVMAGRGVDADELLSLAAAVAAYIVDGASQTG